MKVLTILSAVLFLSISGEIHLPGYVPTTPADLCNLLLWAAEKGDPYLVGSVHASNPGAWSDGAACAHAGTTPLHVAAARNASQGAVRLLLALGADAEAVESTWGRTPLHVAAAAGAFHPLFELLFAGANASAVDSQGDTPLHLVARGGGAFFREMAKELLAAGAERGAVNDRGETPVSIALRADDNTAIVLLTEQTLNKTIPPSRCASDDGIRALFNATRNNSSVTHTSAITYEVFLSTAATTDWCGATKEMRELKFKHSYQLNNNFHYKYIFIAYSGSNVNSRDLFGRTLLHEAARLGMREDVQELLAAGADVNATDWLGQTPLHLARLCNQPDIFRTLETHGADTTVRDRLNRLPEDFLEYTLNTEVSLESDDTQPLQQCRHKCYDILRHVIMQIYEGK